ncbi:hypothetical protein [Corallococcus terminator]|uniref:Uncharacterized protein n=1 Tax=Corallococcus terminator TaxID=2316733 RepID=A0A3A8IR46_9BACT|nr:hypothetical protein [Corallococcus terminator]RKG85198.1 hypothetical protein D7V88_20300 [Corallococcus terminator]
MTKPVWAVLGVVLAVGLAMGPAVAFAQDAKVKVQVEVVLASNKGTAVEPPELNKMKEAFQKQNFSFTSFKRMSLDVVEVGAQSPTEVKLPNGTNASLQLLGMKEGIATLRVIIPSQSSVEVELGRQGAVYQKAGKHVGGDLILVLVPPSK